MNVSRRPVVHAILMTTAIAWSIGVPLRGAGGVDRPLRLGGIDSRDDLRRSPGGTVLPFQRMRGRDAASGPA